MEHDKVEVEGQVDRIIPRCKFLLVKGRLFELTKEHKLWEIHPLITHLRRNSDGNLYETFVEMMAKMFIFKIKIKLHQWNTVPCFAN